VVSNFDSNVPLREPAINWIRKTFPEFDLSRVHFTNTREEKIAKIASLGFDIFVDDLPEVLAHPSFPPDILCFWFAPSDVEEAITGLWRQRCWASIARDVGWLRDFRSRFGSLPRRAQVIEHDGNHEVLRVDCLASTTVLVKKFSQTDQGIFTAAANEVSALEFLRRHGILEVPEPFGVNMTGSVAFFSFLEGKEIVENTTEILDQLVEFLKKLAQLSREHGAGFAGNASANRLRYQDYLDGIERRWKRVSSGPVTDPAAKEFLYSKVSPLKEAIFARFLEKTFTAGLRLDAPFPREELILSPSDFGLHNAKLASDGTLQFLDFEYFGWDDTAKLLADFGHSVRNPIDAKSKSYVVEKFLRDHPAGEVIRERLGLIQELIGLEWVLILLNVFQSQRLQARAEANPGLDPSTYLARRLVAAQRKLVEISR
jgi:hypothetical protein